MNFVFLIASGTRVFIAMFITAVWVLFFIKKNILCGSMLFEKPNYLLPVQRYYNKSQALESGNSC